MHYQLHYPPLPPLVKFTPQHLPLIVTSCLLRIGIKPEAGGSSVSESWHQMLKKQTWCFFFFFFNGFQPKAFSFTVVCLLSLIALTFLSQSRVNRQGQNETPAGVLKTSLSVH